LLLTALAVQGGWYAAFDRIIHDTVIRLVPLQAGDDIILVGIDSRSLSRIGRWPWSRAVQAELLQAVRKHSPQSVFVDVVYTDPGPPSEDALLLAAAHSIDRLVLPLVIDSVTPGGTLLEQLPFPDLLDVTDALGHAHVAPDGDGIVRGSYLFEGIGDPHWPHLGLLFEPDDTFAEQLRSQECAADGTPSIANERCAYRRIRFSGPPGSFQHVSAFEVMTARVDAGLLRDRIVLIGRTDLGAPDAVPVPVSAEIRPMAGVEYNANMLNAVRADGLLTPLPEWIVWSLCLGWALFALVLIPRLQPGQMLSVSVLLTMMPVVFSAAIILFGSRYADVAAASIASALVYPLWSWRRNAMGWRFVGDELDRLAVEAFRWSRRRARVEGTSVQDRFDWLLGAPESGTDPGSGAEERVHLLEAIMQDQLAARGHPDRAADPFVSRLLRIQSLADEVRVGREVSIAGIEQMPVGLCIFVASGNVLLSNTSFRAFTGAEQEHSYFVEAALSALLGVEWQPVLRRLALHTDVRIIETRNASGQRLIARFEPLQVSGYAQPVCLLTLNDVTAIRLAQERRDETLAFVSHDLRSPISSILSIVRNPLLADDPGALRRIEGYARRSLSVSEEFVSLSRLENLTVLHRDEIDLVAVVENAIDQSYEMARERNMQVFLDHADDLPPSLWMPGNGELLERVFANLIDNAIKYSHENGRVRVQLVTEKPGQPGAGFIEVRVIDAGYGIAADELERVFDPYFRSLRSPRPEQSGVGLGLRFVRTAVELHGGTVHVESKEGSGSTFRVRLPAGEPGRAPMDEA
jgi:signal transduction histidine kinase/CHASE2 domain-containing sensor protein